MRMYEIIDKKRCNIPLNKEEIKYFVDEYVNGNIPDYQASALLMAICLNGMTDEETTNLTIAMANSGDKIDLSKVDGVTIDKHSTGGVGDKTTLIVAPIVASLGCKVAKMSGRGLGFTGGTADKLESITGYKLNLKQKDFIDQINKIGISVVSQSENLAPADKKIYALRDVTATVSSIPLIASSIMSKKLALGSDCILIDVKVGNGAFMEDIKSATKLAKLMVNIGTLAGKKVKAVLTNMNVPLGNQIGNILEVKESIEVLQGNGPEDLKQACIELSAYMLMMYKNIDKKTSVNLVKEVLKNGKAFDKFKELVLAQGGNINLINNPELFEKPKNKIEIFAEESGYINTMNTLKIGELSCFLGAGREEKHQSIDYTAGITLLKKTGDFINKGELIANLYTSKENIELEAKTRYLNSLKITNKKPKQDKIVYLVI